MTMSELQTRYLVLIDGREMKSCESRTQAEWWAIFYAASPGCKPKIEKVEWEEGGEMNTCKTCKHWQGDRDKNEWNTFGVCGLLSHPLKQEPYRFDWCCKKDYDDVETIDTHPDFGCVLWEETE